MTRRHHAAGRPPLELLPWHDPSLALGASGPVRVSTDKADPEYVPAPFLGFSIADIAPDHVRQLADLSGITVAEVATACAAAVDAFRPVPLLWQDEGDQA